jgi:hypothetical protein
MTVLMAQRSGISALVPSAVTAALAALESQLEELMQTAAKAAPSLGL